MNPITQAEPAKAIELVKLKTYGAAGAMSYTQDRTDESRRAVRGRYHDIELPLRMGVSRPVAAKSPR
jgi:hypothetical protein